MKVATVMIVIMMMDHHDNLLGTETFGECIFLFDIPAFGFLF